MNPVLYFPLPSDRIRLPMAKIENIPELPVFDGHWLKVAFKFRLRRPIFDLKVLGGRDPFSWPAADDEGLQPFN